MQKIKIAFLYFFVGLAVPTIFLLNAFLVPEPYSHPLIYIAWLPTYLMPFLKNRELLESLTLMFFGRLTPNYAPITIIILIGFWFFASMFGLFLVRYLMRMKKNGLK
jgi:hypothetical protein